MTSPRASLIRIAFSFIRPVSQPSVTESPSQISGGFEAEIRSPIRRDRAPIFSRTHLSAKPPFAEREFATDSPLEGGGFELPVPRAIKGSVRRFHFAPELIATDGSPR